MKKLLITITTVFFLLVEFSTAASAAQHTYKVKTGDTLWSISKKNQVTVQQLKSWNQLKSDIIKPNQVLKLATAPAATEAKPPAPAAKAASYKEITVKATAYTASCKNCSGITATGINLKKNPNMKVISVDPKVIPLGSKVYVPGYGEAIAADKGSSVKGNKIDVFIPSHKQAIQWGNKTVKIKVYN
ncbi:3D domain-containing protein [Bacillus sp. DTU_2020_1000418_1_SI_GHA_SEK_038]|uniref:3D domain-containing protein n=1 Tax=Bacillus sp. DTU_2020_1000418_1_SI_GHA_SEK_038 TaxID=3077585 RepID=UPI0028EC381A|nr:3D domain-containing protein [Bacillus sp. DTU_2020_1000418_1_SI_GHA_SEK_038]WNS75237.1 3D domain-containing protein [Bacillus sp. DTU_2020_1000418_1_SI_GHA_SEK_038]